MRNQSFVSCLSNAARGARNVSGQVLVETMVALSMTVIGLIGILMVLNTSIGLNRVITNQYIASYLASEGIELAGYKLDTNVFSSQPYQTGIGNGSYVVTAGANGQQLTSLSQAVPKTSAGVLASSNALVYLTQDASGNVTYVSSAGSPPSHASVTPYHRVVFVNAKSSDEVVVNSIVAWITKGGVAMSVNVEDHFFNWRNP